MNAVTWKWAQAHCATSFNSSKQLQSLTTQGKALCMTGKLVQCREDGQKRTSSQWILNILMEHRWACILIGPRRYIPAGGQQLDRGEGQGDRDLISAQATVPQSLHATAVSLQVKQLLSEELWLQMPKHLCQTLKDSRASHFTMVHCWGNRNWLVCKEDAQSEDSQLPRTCEAESINIHNIHSFGDANGRWKLCWDPSNPLSCRRTLHTDPVFCGKRCSCHAGSRSGSIEDHRFFHIPKMAFFCSSPFLLRYSKKRSHSDLFAAISCCRFRTARTYGLEGLRELCVQIVSSHASDWGSVADVLQVMQKVWDSPNTLTPCPSTVSLNLFFWKPFVLYTSFWLSHLIFQNRTYICYFTNLLIPLAQVNVLQNQLFRSSQTTGETLALATHWVGL